MTDEVLGTIEYLQENEGHVCVCEQCVELAAHFLKSRGCEAIAKMLVELREDLTDAVA